MAPTNWLHAQFGRACNQLVGSGRIRARRRQSAQNSGSGKNRNIFPDSHHLGLDPVPALWQPATRASGQAARVVWSRHTLHKITRQHTSSRSKHKRACILLRLSLSPLMFEEDCMLRILFCFVRLLGGSTPAHVCRVVVTRVSTYKTCIALGQMQERARHASCWIRVSLAGTPISAD